MLERCLAISSSTSSSFGVNVSARWSADSFAQQQEEKSCIEEGSVVLAFS